MADQGDVVRQHPHPQTRWVGNVQCSRCWGADWVVRDGQWTCTCGKAMTLAEIAKYHASLYIEEKS